MKRPRKRYGSEEQILKAIDALNIKIALECKTAECEGKLADELFQRTGLVEDPSKLKGDELCEYHRDLARAKEARIVSTKLRSVQGRRQKSLLALKETLARFRTQPMAFIGDVSEPLAKVP